jgi:hypothetical protein
VYGRYGDASALADYLELLALQEHELSRSDVADLIADNFWTVRVDELFTAPAVPDLEESDEPDDPEDDAMEPLEEEAEAKARRVFDMLEERQAVLEERYPFSVGDRLTTREGAAPPEATPYIALLAITTAHAYAIETDPKPELVFEDTVTAVLQDRGLLAVNLGRIARRAEWFRDALITVGPDLDLQPTPDAVVTRTFAQEEGVDCIAHATWRDHRCGHWTYIGQVTCAKTEQWDRKLSEPPPGQFEALLGVLTEPTAFLAVPHHGASWHLAWLVTRRKRLVLDRLRLTRFHGGVTADEMTIVNAVRETHVLRP